MTGHHKIHITFFIVYIIAMTIFMISEGIGITPDRYALFLLLGCLFISRTRKFIIDWLPFLFILISYDFLRGLADNLNPRTHYLGQIQFDQWLFSEIPTLTLQKLYYNPNYLQWYDYLATFFYFLHFALPLGFGFILWLKDRRIFQRFTTSLLVLSYSGFITYIIFPASPPWLSSKLGIMPNVIKILDVTLGSFPERLNLPTIYSDFDPNPVAAIPSLHAAYPWLVFLFALKFFRLKSLIFLPYVIAVWISIIYLGEHFVIDVILGCLYGSFAFLIPSQKIMNLLNSPMLYLKKLRWLQILKIK